MSCSSPEFFLFVSSLQFIMSLRFLFLLFFLFSFAVSDDHLPRPLILQYPEKPTATGLTEQNLPPDQTHSIKNPGFNDSDLNNHDTHLIKNPNFNDSEELNQRSESSENLGITQNQHDPQVSENLDFNPIDLNVQSQSNENLSLKDNEQQQLECTSWRFAVEANNVGPWKTVPAECAEYVKEYVTGKGYQLDLERVSSEAGIYARSVVLVGDGKDAWVFDIDETLLSNLPYYADHGFGLEVFNPVEFDKWVDQAAAPAIAASLKLYGEVLGLGVKVFFLTGRDEKQRTATEENLINAGFRTWDKLILRTPDDHGKLAMRYKSEKRSEMVKEGYRILGNSGDQWSDLLGSAMSVRSFKLPNPMYYIP